jgi:hypothetical protein
VVTIFLENVEITAFNSISEASQLLLMAVRLENFAPSKPQLCRFLCFMKLAQIIQSFSDETSPFHTSKQASKQGSKQTNKQTNKTNNRQEHRRNLHLPYKQTKPTTDKNIDVIFTFLMKQEL